MKILILTDKYYPRPLANAVCAQSIANQLNKMGHIVNILAFKDTGIRNVNPNPKIPVYYIKPDYRLRLRYYVANFSNGRFVKVAAAIYIAMNRIKKIIYMPFFPLYSIYFPYRINRLIEKINFKRNYDIIISTFGPLENSIACFNFKKKHKKILWIVYSVDGFINHRHKFLTKKGNTHNYWLPKFLDKCDLFIYMRSRKKEYADSYFDKWRYKIKCSDIPLMINDPIEMPPACLNEVEQWVYAGSLGPPHYITDDLIEIFMGLKDGKKRELHFYSYGDSCEKLKTIKASAQSKVICHPYIAHDKLMIIYKNADVLVSMKYSDQISAKIFEYMTYGKKIVHISGCNSDPDVHYLLKYAKGIVLEPYKYSKDKCIKILLGKLYNFAEKETDLSYFKMNRPEYTADVILNCSK